MLDWTQLKLPLKAAPAMLLETTDRRSGETTRRADDPPLLTFRPSSRSGPDDWLMSVPARAPTIPRAGRSSRQRRGGSTWLQDAVRAATSPSAYGEAIPPEALAGSSHTDNGAGRTGRCCDDGRGGDGDLFSTTVNLVLPQRPERSVRWSGAAHRRTASRLVATRPGAGSLRTAAGRRLTAGPAPALGGDLVVEPIGAAGGCRLNLTPTRQQTPDSHSHSWQQFAGAFCPALRGPEHRRPVVRG